jgi:NADH-quinone oxidoreductase subunit A
MTFIVLDVEIIFLYPFTTIYRQLGGFGLGLMGIFLLVLIVPFAYLLSVGALDWGPVRQVTGRVLGPILRTTTVPSGIPEAAEVAASEDEAA